MRGINRYSLVFWGVIAVVLVIVFDLRPALAHNEWFFALIVAGIVLGGLALSWFVSRKG